MRTCCCCFSLRTGGVIIGVLDLIGGIVGGLGCAVLLGFFAIATNTALDYEKENKESVRSFWDAPSSTNAPPALMNSTLADVEDKEKHLTQLLLIMMTFLMYVMLVLCVVQIIVSSILLYGIRKNSVSFMKVWIIFKLIFLILSILTFILMTCAWGFAIKELVQQVLATVLCIYFIKVIYDLRTEIMEQDNRGGQVYGGQVAYSAKA